MKSTRRLLLLLGACLVAALTMVTANIAVPAVVRIALGVLSVFLVPGFALVCAALPQRELSSSERLLASVGMSIAISICAAVLLGALPIGLSKISFAYVLGTCTLILSAVSGLRVLLDGHQQRNRANAPKGIAN